MKPEPVTHRPTYEDTGLSHWVSCTCSWRSGLSATKQEATEQYRQHLEDA